MGSKRKKTPARKLIPIKKSAKRGASKGKRYRSISRGQAFGTFALLAAPVLIKREAQKKQLAKQLKKVKKRAPEQLANALEKKVKRLRRSEMPDRFEEMMRGMGPEYEIWLRLVSAEDFDTEAIQIAAETGAELREIYTIGLSPNFDEWV